MADAVVGITDVPTGTESVHPVRGIGLKFQKGLGSDVFRTGGSMLVECALDVLVHNVRSAICKRVATDVNHPLRYVVCGQTFWAHGGTPEEVCDIVMRVVDESDTARLLRRSDSMAIATPVALCVCERVIDNDARARVTWLFRHDVIDGWRALVHLFTCTFSDYTLVAERLRLLRTDAHFARGTKRASRVRAILSGVAHAPMAAMKLYTITHAPRHDERSEAFYAHVVCDVACIRDKGATQGLHTLSECLTHAFAASYLRAALERDTVRVGNAVLSNMDSKHGNHMCTKICRVSRRDVVEPSRLGRKMRSASQKMADRVAIGASFRFIHGNMSRLASRWVARRQDAMDILISSLPGTDTSTPSVADLCVCRELVSWKPGIAYCIGINGVLYVDVYMQVNETFDGDAFIGELAMLTSAKSWHRSLPAAH